MASGLCASLPTEQSPTVTAGSVEINSLSKRFGTFVAVQPTTLEVPPGTFATLLGPSGSGKTTILKMIAGFEEPSSGRVRIAGRDVTDVPPHKRNLGFVFQQYALFPHLTVAENIAYPLQMRRLGREEIRTRVTEALELTRLPDLGERHPAQLSGGQQQRVALARAIVFRPPVLLMDEPMSALDKRLREEMQFELRTLQRRLGITTIAVTHDQSEALVMSDLIVVLNQGGIEQNGSPDAVYHRPRSEFVANFIGESNIIRGRRERRDGQEVLVAGEAVIPLNVQAAGTGGYVAYVVRPEAIQVGGDAATDAVRLDGRITEVVFCGDALRLRIDAGLPTELLAKRLVRRGFPVPRTGDRVVVSWSHADGSLIPSGH